MSTDDPHWLEDLFTNQQFWDRKGNAIEFQEWAALLGNRKYKFVAKERIGSWLISTVWLGMEARLSWDQSPPRIFETMIFGRRRYQRGWAWRTEIEALAAHDQICAALRERTHPDKIEVDNL